MTPEKAVEKAIEELQSQYVLLPGHVNIFKRYLYMLYTIGFDAGRHYTNGSKPVLQYDEFGNLLNEYPSAKAAAKAIGVNISNICRVCKGEKHTSGGFIWKYKNLIDE